MVYASHIIANLVVAALNPLASLDFIQISLIVYLVFAFHEL